MAKECLYRRFPRICERVSLVDKGVSMSIHDELSIELRDAMRSKDRARANVVRQIESEVSVAKTAPGFEGDVDDALYLRVIKSYVKKMDKARKEYEALGDRGATHAENLAFEVDYLGRWLPDSLDEDATRSLVKSAIAELGADDVKMSGQVIGQVMRSGQALDGSLVGRLVLEELAE